MPKTFKSVSIGVTEFALPSPRVGSIDIYSGFSRGAETGIEIHQAFQKRRLLDYPEYRAEVPISYFVEAGGFEFNIQGRMDGVFVSETIAGREPVPTKIEEIKSSFNIYELARKIRMSDGSHPFCLQVRTYGYMHLKQTGETPLLRLQLISSRDGESTEIEVPFDETAFDRWLQSRMLELVDEAKRAERTAKRRRESSKALEFPFSKPRAGQVELIESIEVGMVRKTPMQIQAPTGLGKTIGVLFPTLREAMGRGQRIVYATPKNSQHAVAEDAISRMQERAAKIKSLTITSKSKICLKNEPICNPDFCEYANEHYTKVAENGLIEKLAKKKILNAKMFKKMGEEFEVCPFELQIAAAHDADAVICDYNYVFTPGSALTRLGGLVVDQDGKSNLVIDEAHNLPSRSMDSYSPALSTFVLEQMRDDAKLLPFTFRAEALELLQECIDVVRACAPKKSGGASTGDSSKAENLKSVKIKPPLRAFLEQDARVRSFLSGYLKSNVEIQPRDVILRWSMYWSQFTEILESVSENEEVFVTTFNYHPDTVRITCCDASAMLKESYKSYDQVVAFSATLKPFEFYQQLSGFDPEKLINSEFASPFPKSNRKILIIPQISTKYSEREQNYARIADAIAKIIKLKVGNYVAFFPSFDFLTRVMNLFKAPEPFELLTQPRKMKSTDIEDLLEILEEPQSAKILFAVQGGMLSEGIDFAGNRLIGAFVVGPPLPNFDLEREEMRKYYESHYASGFDYAYTYPAMAKAVQAAGRVIRSETDKGIIVLMDSRFLLASYAKSMPGDWFETSPRELVSDKILNDVKLFWEAADTQP